MKDVLDLLAARATTDEILVDYPYLESDDISAQVMAHLRSRAAIIDLPTACHTGDIDRARELLRQDSSLANRLGGYEGYYPGAGAPLANAAAAGRLDIVHLLLDRGADPNPPEGQIAREANTRRCSTVTTTS